MWFHWVKIPDWYFSIFPTQFSPPTENRLNFSIPTLSAKHWYFFSHLFIRKANNCFDFLPIFRPTKPQLNWNENQILMKQTMKRQWADWWKCGRMPKDPTWGWNFHFTVFLLFLFFFFYFSAAPFYAGPYIVAVLVATLSVFCLQVSISFFCFLFLSFNELSGAHTTYTLQHHRPPISAPCGQPWIDFHQMQTVSQSLMQIFFHFFAALSICDLVFSF